MTTGDGDDDGFTLIELLIVLVIMPLIVGAIAAAIIVSLQDATTTKVRLADSSNAQITSTFFAADVQGAQFVTTTITDANGNPLDPAICVKPGLPSPTLVLGLHRLVIPSPPLPAPPDLSVGYWVTNGPTPELVRDSCSEIGANKPVFGSEVILSDDVSPADVSAAITPSQFATLANAGWTASLSPTPPASPTASISSISLSVSERGSNYTFNLLAAPRVWSSQPTG